jgi:hypothetical protein
MKVATARYTGSMRTHHRETPSGESYNFLRTEVGCEPVVITDVEDARYLADQPPIEVDWTPIGRLKAAGDSMVDAVSDLGYSAKQRLVGEAGFDLDVAGNAPEDELEEALKQHVEELDNAGDI